MRRNADLDYVKYNPLLSAINVVLSKKRKQKKEIWLLLAGFICSFFYYLRIKQQSFKQQKKLKLLEIQYPFNKDLLLMTNRQWEEGNYDEFTYLLPQYKQIGRMSVFKDIFVYSQSNQNIQLGNLAFAANSNNVLTKNIPRNKLKQTFLPTIPLVILEDTQIDFARQKPFIQSAFLKDFNENQISNGLLRESTKHPEQKQILFNFIASKLFRNEKMFSGIDIQWTYPQPISLNKQELLCMQCTAVIKDDKLRLTNIKAVASNFGRLQGLLKSNLLQKISTLQSKLSFSKFLMGFFGFLTIYQIGKYLYHQLEPYMLKQEYPGLERVKKRLNEVICDQGSKCLQCKSRSVDFIFVPCYHLQCCKQCFNEQKQIECKSCKQMIYCGIPIFVCK